MPVRITRVYTRTGDDGTTALVGGTRVAKDSQRIAAYGTIDELISTLGFARSICADEGIRTRTKAIQKELFAVGSAMATPPEGAKKPPEIGDALVDALTAEVHRIEAMPGILADWSIPGEHAESAAYDVARTVCRRAERRVVELGGSVVLPPIVVVYLNRLSDLLFVLARVANRRAGAGEVTW